MSWALVIFASREPVATLLKTINAAQVAAQGLAHIDVLVNGNPQLAADITWHFRQGVTLQANASLMNPTPTSEAATTAHRIRIWSISLGDKANAWNQYVHHIWVGESIAFFIDGYVRLNPDAIQLLGNAVAADQRSLGGSGVPTAGRSAKALRHNLIVNTGFHGNFCCMKGNFLAQMRESAIFLPLGLYRVDSLVGSFICYALDPATQIWEDYFIVVHPSASWQIDEARWWQPHDLWAFCKRFFRQARGQLENRAFSDHLAIRRQLPQYLPATAKDLVLEWAERCPAELQATILGYPLAWWAFKGIRDTKHVEMASSAPNLFWQG